MERTSSNRGRSSSIGDDRDHCLSSLSRLDRVKVVQKIWTEEVERKCHLKLHSQSHTGLQTIPELQNPVNERSKSDVSGIPRTSSPLQDSTRGTRNHSRDKELTSLSMSDLETILLQLRVDRDEICGLSRWDRVTVVRDFRTSEGRKLGYKGEDLMRYISTGHHPDYQVEGSQEEKEPPQHSRSPSRRPATAVDFRKFSMSELGSILLDAGMTKKEISALGRWERASEIRGIATEARRLGKAEHLWAYARDVLNK